MPLKILLLKFFQLPYRLFIFIKSHSEKDSHKSNEITIIWTSVNFGTLISSRSFFLGLREKFNEAGINLIVNSKVYKKIVESKLTYKKFFDNIICYNNSLLTLKFLNESNALTIVPTLEKFYLNDFILLAISNSSKNIGVQKINNDKNPFRFLIKDKINIDYSHNPDIHISQILLEQLKQLGDFSEPDNFVLNFNLLEDKYIREMKRNLGFDPDKKIIAINFSSEREQYKISSIKLLKVFNQLSEVKEYQFCFIDDAKKTNLKSVENDISKDVLVFPNNNIKELFNFLNFVDLIITCDSEFMHIAGVLGVPQISLFGISNPFRYSPLGKNKIFIKKSDLIDEIEVKDIINETEKIISKW